MNVVHCTRSVRSFSKGRPLPSKWDFKYDIQTLGNSLLSGNRVALSRAITLIESFKPQHIEEAQKLLEQVVQSKHKLNKRQSFRIGIAGPPGAGKSTFIDVFGEYLLQDQSHKYKVAVLAIDPSSTRTGGSILGDKTRMDRLAQHDRAFVRPSPTSGKLGGIAQHTNEVILLCEAAGYDIVIVETVGLGQSEVLVDEVVDMVLMLTPPQMGDDLQGVKKGIMEIADMVIVNKADGELATKAKHAAIEYVHTFRLIRPKHTKWSPKVHRVSAMKKMGIEKVWQSCSKFQASMGEEGLLMRRQLQSNKMVWTSLMDQVARLIKGSPDVKKQADELQLDLALGQLTPRKAANSLLKQFLKDNK